MTVPGRPAKRQVFAWSLWDWASSGYTVIIVTFVFPVYLTDAIGDDLGGTISASTWLGWAIGLAGLCVALTAPVSGQLFDASGRRKLALGILTVLFVLTTAASALLPDQAEYFWIGLVLYAVGSVFYELSQVPYFAMLRQVSTPQNIGRVSGLGFAMGYFGGIALLLAAYVGFLAGAEGSATKGLFDISTEDGLNVRLVFLLAATWIAVFALPLFLSVPEVGEVAKDPQAAKAGFIGSYRVLFRDVRELWHANPNAVYFLGASALFRDALAGVFTFGGVLAVNVYGISAADVLLFGVAANVVAALGALIAGRFDDRVGPKRVIVVSLVSMVVVSAALLVAAGPLEFWILGLALCLFVGPIQSSARTFLARMCEPGREGQMFGLYAMTGRGVSFLAPSLFGLFAYLFASDRAGIVGIMIVLVAGLTALVFVRAPRTSTVVGAN